MVYSASAYLSLPQNPGVYLFLDKNGKIIYVGKAKNLKNRVSSYFSSPTTLLGKTAILVPQVEKIKIIIVESELEALLLEANLIKKYDPKYNISLKDGKAYPLIRITVKSQYPSVLTARHMDDTHSIYFGPYPNVMSMRRVLRLLRRIFPYQSVPNHPKKICLYHHLGLCPCLPAFPDETYQKEYKKTIHHIIDFLNGKTKKVIKELEKERNLASKQEDFEQAAHAQKQLDSIAYITQPIHQPFEYETNPNLSSDLRYQEMKELQTILAKYNVFIDLPTRIECYDISNIQGTNPTASMVVLTNGEIDKSQYRKFKMQTRGPNDFAMMQEVLSRRLKHNEWDMPQLFIVDGGKGQISSAREVLNELGVTTPLVGLAKREETIITSDFQEISLPKRSPALQLVMRIRDEAHRFAITFHRKLRSKGVFQ